MVRLLSVVLLARLTLFYWGLESRSEIGFEDGKSDLPVALAQLSEIRVLHQFLHMVRSYIGCNPLVAVPA